MNGCPPLPVCTYQLDRENRLVAVGQDWDAFARANEGGHLTARHVMGRKLWEFIADLETRHLYELLLAKVRAKGTVLELPLRCDSPAARRFLEMCLAREGELVDFTVRTLRVEVRPAVALLDPLIPRSERLLRICSWCKQLLLRDGAWVEVEEGVRQLRLFDAARLPQLTHGICPSCRARVEKRARVV